MTVDFLSLLNESNSLKNDETGEITLTIPKFESQENYIIKSKSKISSNCNTVISCPKVIFSSEDIDLQNISFESSIEVKNLSNFTMIDCYIKNAKSDTGISFQNCNSVQISNIIITDIEAKVGMLILKNSHVYAKNISINGSMEVIIGCNEESSFYLSDSNFNNHKSRVISITNDCYVEVNNCQISDIIYPAIYVHKSSGKITNNEIKNVSMNGIVLNNVNSFEIEKNKITDINGSAISVINDSSCDIHNNIISKVCNNGIYVDNNSQINAYNNELTDIKYPAIAILKKSKATITENKISNMNSCGIRVIHGKDIEIKRNEIKDIQECGISILNTKECSVTNNNITNCNVAAIEAYNKSVVNIAENHISDVKEYAFLAYTSGKITAKNNTISNVGKSMTNLIYKGGGEFTDNKLENCPKQNESNTSSPYYFNGNGDFPGVTNDESKKAESIHFDEITIDNNDLCLKCNKKHRQCFLLNCGHKVYCQDCAEESVKNHQACPLCRLPIVEINEGFTTKNEYCGICCENQADCIVMPCGHIGFCHKCLNHWFQKNQRCPYCQVEPVTYTNIQDL